MAIIYNSEFIQKAIKNLKLAPMKDKMPTEIADKVLLTYSINHPYNIQVKSSGAVNSTTATIHTCITNGDTYIVSACLSTIKDATATSIRSAVRATCFDLVASDLLSIASLSLTAQTGTISNNFPIPIKLARGSLITVINTTNVGNVTSLGEVQFFEVPD